MKIRNEIITKKQIYWIALWILLIFFIGCFNEIKELQKADKELQETSELVKRLTIADIEKEAQKLAETDGEKAKEEFEKTMLQEIQRIEAEAERKAEKAKKDFQFSLAKTIYPYNIINGLIIGSLSALFAPIGFIIIGGTILLNYTSLFGASVVINWGISSILLTGSAYALGALIGAPIIFILKNIIKRKKIKK